MRRNGEAETKPQILMQQLPNYTGGTFSLCKVTYAEWEECQEARTEILKKRVTTELLSVNTKPTCVCVCVLSTSVDKQHEISRKL